MQPYECYADVLEAGAWRQFESAMNLPGVIRGALMADAHQGYALPIGAVVATEDMVYPSWVGYDIGCGVYFTGTTFDEAKVRMFAEEIYDEIAWNVPLGFNHGKHVHPWVSTLDFRGCTPIVLDQFLSGDAGKQIGSLGGGNHFIEIGVNPYGNVGIAIHSGSRNLGHKTATAYMKMASRSDKAKEGHYGFDVESVKGQQYLADVNFCQEFALLNRRAILNTVIDSMQRWVEGDAEGQPVNRNHNHVEHAHGMWIHRKGATHAEEGMLGVIPGNMRDGFYLVRGKGSAKSLWSSSHGAGRVMSRKEAKKVVSVKDFKDAMGDVTCKATPETLDESPFAYKDIEGVMRQQRELLDIVTHFKPIINVKG